MNCSNNCSSGLHAASLKADEQHPGQKDIKGKTPIFTPFEVHFLNVLLASSKQKSDENKGFCIRGATSYPLGNTSPLPITEVKQRSARLVLGWETVQVLSECC